MTETSEKGVRSRFPLRPKHMILFSYLENPFPLSQDEYWGTNWYYWVKRIDDGHQGEVENLNIMTKDVPDEIACEWYAGDYGNTLDITRSMYAALAVSVWSSVERFINISMCCIALKKNIDCSKLNFSIRKAVDFMLNEAGIELCGFSEFYMANAVRILSNSFKHNAGIYVPDGFTIKEDFAAKFEIKSSQYILYENLLFAELIVGCGLFCNDLRSRIRTEIN